MTRNTKATRAVLAGIAAGLIVAGAAGAVVAAGGNDSAPSRGTIPDRAFRDDGSLDQSLVPDLVSVQNDEGSVVGYARRADIAAPQAAPSTIVDVWDDTGEELVGHVYPDGTGFLSVEEERKLGVSPQDPLASKTPPTTIVGG